MSVGNDVMDDLRLYVIQEHGKKVARLLNEGRLRLSTFEDKSYYGSWRCVVLPLRSYCGLLSVLPGRSLGPEAPAFLSLITMSWSTPSWQFNYQIGNERILIISSHPYHGYRPTYRRSK